MLFLYGILIFMGGMFFGGVALALAAASGRESSREEGFEWGYEAGKKDHEKNRCHWKYDPHNDKWDTECGEVFVFLAGGPKENDIKYCPYCGYKIDLK